MTILYHYRDHWAIKNRTVAKHSVFSIQLEFFGHRHAWTINCATIDAIVHRHTKQAPKLPYFHFPQAQACRTLAQIHDTIQLFTQCKNLLRAALVWANYVSTETLSTYQYCAYGETAVTISILVTFIMIYPTGFLRGKHIPEILDDIAAGLHGFGAHDVISHFCSFMSRTKNTAPWTSSNGMHFFHTFGWGFSRFQIEFFTWTVGQWTILSNAT